MSTLIQHFTSHLSPHINHLTSGEHHPHHLSHLTAWNIHFLSLNLKRQRKLDTNKFKLASSIVLDMCCMKQVLFAYMQCYCQKNSSLKSFGEMTIILVKNNFTVNKKVSTLSPVRTSTVPGQPDHEGTVVLVVSWPWGLAVGASCLFVCLLIWFKFTNFSESCHLAVSHEEGEVCHDCWVVNCLHQGVQLRASLEKRM